MSKRQPRLTKIEEQQTEKMKYTILVDTITNGRDLAIAHITYNTSDREQKDN